MRKYQNTNSESNLGVSPYSQKNITDTDRLNTKIKNLFEIKNKEFVICGVSHKRMNIQFKITDRIKILLGRANHVL